MLIHSDSAVELRSIAGVKLKNSMLNKFQLFDSDTLIYVKTHISKGLSDPNVLLRNVTGNVITTLVTKVGIDGWPEILPELMSLVESAPQVITQESAMSTLTKICEDSAKVLDQEYPGGQRPLEYMIPKFLQFTESPSQKVRALSIAAINQFVFIKSQSLLPHIDAFLNAIFKLTSDNFSDTKINICHALVNIMYSHPGKLVQHLEGVLNYIIHCMVDDDEQVAGDACEFILQLAESGDSFDHELIKQFLPTIIPAVLRTMVYSELDRELLQSLAEDDQDVEDRPEDIRPQFAKAKEHAPTQKSGSNLKSSNNQKSEFDNDGDENIEDEDDDEDDEEEDDRINESLAEWNLRKCSAAALDVFAAVYPETVLELVLPYLREYTVSDKWYIREAAILAFGAISQGCIELISPNLPELIPFLVSQMKVPEPAVRQIACWAVSRYCTWIAYQSFNGNHEAYLQPVLRALLDCCLDKNKKVQEAACSACSILTEEATDELIPYLEPILQQYAEALRRYRTKNRLNLYDSIQTLFDKVGIAAASPTLANIIVPVLHERWAHTSDDDTDLWPLMECLSTVTAVLGMYMIQQAPNMYARCVKIISESIIMEQNHDIDPTIDIPEKDFEITALDLIDGLVQGLKNNMSELTRQAQPPLPELLAVCFEDEVYDVRQSALAVLGDIAIHAIDIIVPYLNTIIKAVISQMDMKYTPGVCNNAIWSAGEIALRLKGSMEPFAQELFSRLWQLLDSDDAVSTVWENAATAMGRLGQGVPTLMAPQVGTIIQKWCYHISDMAETEEKDSAYIGMCQVVSANPSGISDEAHLSEFVALIAQYTEPTQQLSDLVSQVLQGYKSMIPDWNGFVSKLPPSAQTSIKQRYQL